MAEIHSGNLYWYQSTRQEKSNRLKLLDVCEKYGYNFDNEKDKIKPIRKRLTVEEILKIIKSN